MRKSITKQDGSTEVIEGTPEEIAEYERKLRGEVKEAPEKKPGLLTDYAEKFLRGTFQEPIVMEPREHSPNCQITQASRGWWSVVPPTCTCGKGFDFLYVTRDSTYVGDVIPNPYIATCATTKKV